MELPAGGTFRGEVSCNKGQTTFGGTEWDPPKLERLACDIPGANGNMGSIHALDMWPGPADPADSHSVKGCGLAIAYEADVYKVKPEDFVVISVNHTCPFKREVDFQIPEGLPACPEGGCHCLWGWVPDPLDVRQNYILGYRCNVTGSVGTEYPAKPVVARKCPFDRNNCTVGAKQMHFIDQNEGNNNFQHRDDPPFYNDDYGFHNGAQMDIWKIDDGSSWNTNTSDVAPAPWKTQTSVDWSTSMNPTWTTTPATRTDDKAVATQSAQVFVESASKPPNRPKWSTASIRQPDSTIGGGFHAEASGASGASTASSAAPTATKMCNRKRRMDN